MCESIFFHGPICSNFLTEYCTTLFHRFRSNRFLCAFHKQAITFKMTRIILCSSYPILLVFEASYTTFGVALEQNVLQGSKKLRQIRQVYVPIEICHNILESVEIMIINGKGLIWYSLFTFRVPGNMIIFFVVINKFNLFSSAAGCLYEY